MTREPPGGRLSVVGTPIGNLEDLSPRALGTLRAAAAIVAEDTRRTRALLAHFGVGGKALIALDAHASEARVDSVLRRLAAGERVALVTDAGMPGVSDPGARLVRAARDAGVAVEVLPGPSAVTAAAALSGLVEGPFVFAGFLPRKGGARRDALARVAGSAWPVVLFEAKGRLEETLRELAALAPDRRACVCRELTKLHEEVVEGRLAELAALGREWLGELTVVVAPRAEATGAAAELAAGEDLDALATRLLAAGRSPKDAAAELAAAGGIPRRDAYERVLRAREASPPGAREASPPGARARR
ncbi:MAG: 16S rRNA (cytidine(1402)-2'-O)-methyltransferase [Polyangiaceae bacterium]|nr:16S rRNA (cytidine(1402)-2'-O)-methyltransferase [Polyangiaceae bacterium]